MMAEMGMMQRGRREESRTSPERIEEAGGGADISLRRLDGGDAGEMAKLEQRCFSLPWSLRQCEAALAQRSFAAFGAFAKDVLIAYVSVYHAAGEMEIVNLAVAPKWRRRGFGRRILDMVLQVARKMGMQRVSLEVRPSNGAALALYAAAGFVGVGRRRRYYPDTGEDALIQEFKIESKG